MRPERSGPHRFRSTLVRKVVVRGFESFGPGGLDELASVRKQCALLHLSRSNLYYEPVEVEAEELALMRQIDKLYLEHPGMQIAGPGNWS